ncbi:unnamed protein product [Mesocestoides corti]|uniref:Mst1/2 SARAH domain-containing protein n=1 Tax=Mesocestoides corti TaxID=53468 RepID=A0A0R3UBK3_MESCO|nr:unnamed protein product [Mesocestoides corti]
MLKDTKPSPQQWRLQQCSTVTPDSAIDLPTTSASPSPSSNVGVREEAFGNATVVFFSTNCSSSALELSNEPGGLSKLFYLELEPCPVNLGRDLETELHNLAIRYRHKRQPLLDAIAEKTATLAP